MLLPFVSPLGCFISLQQQGVVTTTCVGIQYIKSSPEKKSEKDNTRMVGVLSRGWRTTVIVPVPTKLGQYVLNKYKIKSSGIICAWHFQYITNLLFSCTHQKASSHEGTCINLRIRPLYKSFFTWFFWWRVDICYLCEGNGERVVGFVGW